MISKDECIHLGTVIKSHGYKGEYLLTLDRDYSQDLTNKEPVFLEIDGILVPFFMTSLKVRNNLTAVVHFNDITTESRTKKIIGAHVFFPSQKITADTEEDNSYEDCIGFSVFDEDKNNLGNVVDIMDIPGNLVFVMQTEDKEVMVPANSHTIIEINTGEQRIVMQLPEGLLDIY
jgi:16S rRNA processing protein RimM